MENSERIGSITLSTYKANNVVKRHNGRSWALVGDAALGVPYFRSANAGLKCDTKLSKLLADCFKHRIFDSPARKYQRYVKQVAQQEIIAAKAKNDFIKVGRVGAWLQNLFPVARWKVSRDLERNTLENSYSAEDITATLTTYLTFAYNSNHDSQHPLMQDVLSYIGNRHHRQHAKAFPKMLQEARQLAQDELGENVDQLKLNQCSNAVKSDAMLAVYQKQQYVAKRQLMRAKVLSVFGLILPGISHAIIWIWYAIMRYRDPIKSVTVTESKYQSYQALKQSEPQQSNSSEILAALSRREPVRGKAGKPQMRKSVIAHDNNQIEILATRWNQQAKKLSRKLDSVAEINERSVASSIAS